jgi:hypothetical protein
LEDFGKGNYSEKALNLKNTVCNTLIEKEATIHEFGKIASKYV